MQLRFSVKSNSNSRNESIFRFQIEPLPEQTNLALIVNFKFYITREHENRSILLTKPSEVVQFF